MTSITRGYADALGRTPGWTVSNRLIHRLTRRAGQVWCGLLHGHDHVLLYEPSRVFLRCATCEHESPGWKVDEPRYRVTQPIDVCRWPQTLLRLPLRRAA